MQGSTLETLRAGLRGTAHVPGEEGYDDASRAWNLAAHQAPALVVVAGGAADVMAAVRFARDAGMGVGVMATGHGVGAPCDGGVLINTSKMRGVRVDPVSRTARVEAGALWADVVHEAQPHGLGGLMGSTSHVGVVGYTMGGGFGWLGRKYGFNAASVREADVVTADGELVRLSAEDNPDLFWGLGGGGGNFGIVTSLKFDLYPVGTLYGGDIIYPMEKAAEVLDAYARWSADLPDEMVDGGGVPQHPPAARAARAAAGQIRHSAARLLLWGVARGRRGDVAPRARGARRADHGHLRSDALRGHGLHKHGPRRPDGGPPALRDAGRALARGHRDAR